MKDSTVKHIKTIHMDSKEEKNMIIETHGKKSKISTSLLVSDFDYKYQNYEGNESRDNKEIIAQIISSHSMGVFTTEEIKALDSSYFGKYIDLCVASDDVLQKNYNELDEIADIEERFILALDNTLSEYAEIMRDSLRPCLEEMTFLPKDTIADSLTPIVSLTQAFQTVIVNAAEIIRPYISTISSQLTNYSKLINDMVSSLNEWLKTIKIPGLSEEEKQRRISAYEKWGELGWTIPPDANITVFNIMPENENDAYQTLRVFINDSYMESYFDELLNMKHIRRADLLEAIDCFNNKRYKACAMIIYSMIDSRLIRSQQEEEKHKNGTRPSGKKAAKNLFGRFKAKDMDKGVFFLKLNQLNVLSAIGTYYAYGGDFKIQPQVINRNFLNHGMLHRKVLRKDCAKLFLLLYNFTLLLDSYYK